MNHSESGTLKHNLDIPCTYFLRKPFHPHQLTEIIDHIEVACS